jgi:ATP synthase protein I
MGMPDPPDDQPPQGTSSSKDGALKSLSGVQSLLQLGLLLPACVVIGWAVGLALDHWLNLHWVNIVGLIAGAIAGFIQTVRVAMSHNKD